METDSSGYAEEAAGVMVDFSPGLAETLIKT